MLKSLPVQLILIVIGGLFIADYLDKSIVAYFYTFSCLLKEFLMALLPFIIFSYLTAAILSFQKQGPFLIFSLIVFVILSNGLTVLTAYGIGNLTFPFINLSPLHTTQVAQEIIKPLWSFNLPQILSSEIALLLGLVIGVCVNFIKDERLLVIARQIAFLLRRWSTIALKKGFVPFLPLYVLGFILKLDKEGSLTLLMQNFGQIFLLSCVFIVAYVVLMYAIAANFKWDSFINYIREMLPAGLTGFSTMSSAAAMPVTLNATEKNLNERAYADFAISTTVNIHLVGDGLNIALTGLALLLMNGQPMPSFSTYFIFTVYYCLAKFSCAGIPGGGVIVILPVLQTYLGLSPELSTVLATIYILQDPILTGANVMGNGAFAIITKKILTSMKLMK